MLEKRSPGMVSRVCEVRIDMVVDPARLQHNRHHVFWGASLQYNDWLDVLEFSLFLYKMQLNFRSIIPLHNKFGHWTVPSLRMNDDIDSGQRCLKRDKNSRWWQVFALLRTLNGCFVVGPWREDDHEDHE